MIECKVCEEEYDFSPDYSAGWYVGCMTDLGFVCRKCVSHWLEDYLQMVNPFLHLEGKKVFKLRRKEE